MTQDFSIAISSRKNMMSIVSNYGISSKHLVHFNDVLSVIPITEAFLDDLDRLFPNDEENYREQLAGEWFDTTSFLIDYSDTPIILYEISYGHGGGKGDEAWLFKDKKLVKHYIESLSPSSIPIGDVFDRSLEDSGLDIGGINDNSLSYFELFQLHRKRYDSDFF